MKNKLAAALKQARINSGYSQEQAAQHLGVQRSTIGNYESGRSKPNIERFIRLCDFYHVDFVRLSVNLYGTPYEPDETREVLLEAITDHMRRQNTDMLQDIEWIFSARHTARMEPLIQLIKLYLHLDISSRIHAVEWILGCYSLLKSQGLAQNTGIMEPSTEEINIALKELHLARQKENGQ